jgi:hypothetical protein
MIELVAVGLMSVGTVIAIWSLPKFWRGEGIPRYERSSRSFWVWGEGALQGWIRSAPVGFVGCGALVVGGWSTVLRRATEDPVWLTVADFFIYPSFAVLLACIGLMITVTLFNVPKQLVPPSLRHQSGLLRYWLDQRQRARQRKSRSRPPADPPDT